MRALSDETIKKPTNVSVNAGLLRQAKVLEINLSATLEKALEQQIKERLRADWLKENASSISSYNEDVMSRGTFSDGLRSF